MLAFVFSAIDHTNDAAHELDVETAVGGNLLGGMQILDVILEHGIEYIVGRERIAILLVRAQLG